MMIRPEDVERLKSEFSRNLDILMEILVITLKLSVIVREPSVKVLL